MHHLLVPAVCLRCCDARCVSGKIHSPTNLSQRFHHRDLFTLLARTILLGRLFLRIVKLYERIYR